LAYHLLLSFTLFRIFDITKPSIIGMVDKKIKSGYGVMLDDVIAGLFSAAVICITIIIIKQF
jgi:phosphatidylglycerophosphatase A